MTIYYMHINTGMVDTEYGWKQTAHEEEWDFNQEINDENLIEVIKNEGKRYDPAYSKWRPV